MLRADVGDVRVTSGGNGVTVDVVADAGESALKDHHVDFRQEGNTLYVDGDYDHGRSWFDFNHIRVRYTIQVPSRFDLDVKTSGGDLNIGDLAGEITARTSGRSFSALAFDSIRVTFLLKVAKIVTDYG